MVTVFKSSKMIYSLDEIVNRRCKSIEDEHGEIIDIQIKEDKAHIIYKI